MAIQGIICGPTGVGKSDFAIQVAIQNNFEIISVDASQVYQDTVIGTAQVKNQKGIKHHLMGSIPFTEEFSVVDFTKKVNYLIKQNPQTQFLLVGGSGFYFKVLFSKGESLKYQISQKTKDKVQKILEEEGSTSIYQKLKKIEDPRVEELHPNDSYRLTKAYEYRLETGRSYIEHRENNAAFELPVESYFLSSSRESLYQKINDRTLKMLEEGWIGEVERLLKLYPIKIQNFKALGYPQILKMLQGKLNENQTIKNIQKESRRLAKRQITFFKNQFLNLKEIDNVQDLEKLNFSSNQNKI